MKFKIWISKEEKTRTFYMEALDLSDFDKKLNKMLTTTFKGWSFNSCWGGGEQ